MDHAAWMESHNVWLRRGGKRPDVPKALNEFQKRVVDILGMVGGGIYNAPIDPSKIDWHYGGSGVSVVWQHHCLATFDFGQLTLFVFLCHEARIRGQIEAAGPKNLRFSFWQRESTGDVARRHPDLDEALAGFRQYLPVGHRIKWNSTALLSTETAPTESPKL